jgi:hypothetical protein
MPCQYKKVRSVSRRPANKLDPDQALFREALRQWLGWYLSFHGDDGRRYLSGSVAAIAGTVYDAAMRGLGRPEGQHADHVLGKLLADERRQHEWPASIHAIIMDMPRDCRICLYGTAMEYSQSTIGRQLGLRQQLVSAMLSNARRTLLIRLKVLARTQRMIRDMRHAFSLQQARPF